MVHSRPPVACLLRSTRPPLWLAFFCSISILSGLLSTAPNARAQSCGELTFTCSNGSTGMREWQLAVHLWRRRVQSSSLAVCLQRGGVRNTRMQGVRSMALRSE